MSRRSYKALDDKAPVNGAAVSSRRARASRNSAASSALVLGLTTNIGELAKMCAKLERALARLHTINDTPAFRARLQDDQHDTAALVKATIESLAAAQPELDGTQYRRLSLQFEQTYKRYTALTKQIDDRQKQSIAQAQANSHGSYGDHGTRNGNGNRYNAANDFHQPLNSETPSEYGGRQQEEAYEDDITFTETDHEEIVRRVEEIKQIESEVSEVAQLYKDLHVLVGEQQADIDTISEHVEVVQHKVEEGHVSLVSAASNQRSASRWKCWTALIVFLVIGIAIVVLLVLKKTSVF